MMDMSVEVDYLDLPYAPVVQLTLAQQGTINENEKFYGDE